MIEKQFLVEFSTKMPDDLLIVDDATSMIHSLEARAPLLDNELIELCFKMPTNYKVNGGQGKFILRKAMKGILPDSIINKQKWGFIPNTYSWFKKDFKDLASQILPNGNIIKQGFFKKEAVEKIFKVKIPVSSKCCKACLSCYASLANPKKVSKLCIPIFLANL